MTKLNFDDYEVIDTTMVASLGAAHTGDDVVMVTEKSYRYAGEDRKKMRTFMGVSRVEHYATSTKFHTRIYGKEPGQTSYWPDWYELTPSDQVVVMRKKVA